MKKQVTDRYLTSVFSLLLTGMYCMVAINSFFMLMLSQQGLSEATLARVATATSTASLIAPFILGQLCDRLRLHKPLFFLGLFIGPLSLFIIRGTDVLPVIVLCAVLLSGLCMNLQIIPAGWIASLNAGGRKIDFGFARSFGSLSFALMSVVVGIVLERFGMISMPVMMALMAVTVLIPVLMLPKPERVTRNREDTPGLGATVKELASNRPYMILLVCNALASIPGGAYYTFFAVHFEQLGGTESLLGIANFVLALVEVPVMLFYSRLEKKFGMRNLMALAIFGYGLKNFCLGLAGSTGMAIACLSLQAIGLALIVPASQSMTAALVPAKYSSTAQSLVFSAQSVGGILANVLCAWLVERVNLHSVFQITSYFAFAGVLLFWATVILPAAKAGKDK